MIGRKAEAVLNRAVRFAMEHEHEYFALEHVLWSLLDEIEVIEILEACGASSKQLRADLESYLHREIPKAAPREGNVDQASQPEHPIATLSIQRLIQRALFHVQSSGKDEIKPVDLLVALFQAKESQALYLLTKEGVERLDVLNYISHGVKKDADDDSDSSDDDNQSNDERGTGGGDEASADPLKLYTENLNQRAQAGKVDPLLGRKVELERMIQTLCRRRKNNPLLVGEAGVGKTALAEGLATRIVSGDIPDLLQNSIVYSLDLGSLLAGAKFRGDFEQRLKRVLAALQKKKSKGRNPILFIDEIHTIVGAGAVGGGVLDAANLLKPLLAQGEIRCIGSTTYTEYRNIFEKDHALARRFQKIDIVEPTQEEAIQILSGLKSRFEDYHEVSYTNEAIRAAVELSSKHLTERFLPDKAIDVIDEAGAKARLARSKAEAERAQAPVQSIEQPIKPAARHVIEASEIEDIIAQIARIPPRSVNSSQKDRLKNLERDLKLTIFGQGHAIEALVTSIQLARSGLRSGDRPIGSFLLCGPTGVGKTELSKQLAHCLGVPFLRFDMSEYGEKHTVSRLIGAPPGYVGFEQAGLLTSAVLKNPHSVILLDEIEKAHPDIWNILLQVMDHGTLTDNNGRKADFRHSTILMTSNVGSRDLEKRSLGFEAQSHGSLGASVSKNAGKGAQKAVEQTFSPEFRNRLDAIVYFNPLDPLTVGHVVGKQIVELESQLLSKGVEIEIDSQVREWLALKGYDKFLGARPMNRLIQDKIKKHLAEEILFGKLENGGHVHVFLKDDEPAFEFREIKKASGDSSQLQSAGQSSDSETHRVR
ncbi:MAG: ATP-dependent Clp protease ATP-binding subunit ClpA [Methylotenera sp.]|nr:ATP-dependent Clp protease ATP-binding subunit ClpA [Oligoflexia bacterium]